MNDWLPGSEALETRPEREAFWDRSEVPEDAPALIHAQVLAFLHTDLRRAERFAGLSTDFAGWRGDPTAAAFAARCAGHVHYMRGENESAARVYANAAALFEQTGAESELARTLSSGLQALCYQGRYDEAREWADRAAEIFIRHGDRLRLARLESNVGNLYFRLDQPAEALVRYERALAGFRELGDPKDVAAVLSNLAVCRTNLGQLDAALENYREARDHCERFGMEALAAQADYNIAYLFYLRGDYTHARRQYAVSRERSASAGDSYHAALCDLDEAEMALELNLMEEGGALASRAETAFAALGLRYEQAKSLVNIAVSKSQCGDAAQADLYLRRARRLFAKEGNAVWPALVDQLRAVLAFHAGNSAAAQRLGSRAWRALREITVPARAAHSQLLLARLWLRKGNTSRALAVSRDAIARLGEDVSPSVRFHANLLEGEISERKGNRAEALRRFEAARRDVEDMRGRVDTEDLRISLLKDKLAVYDSLVTLLLDSPGGSVEALSLVQQAKSRSLADRVGAVLCGTDSHWRELRWLYRQSSLGATLRRAGIAAAGQSEIESRIRRLESELRLADPEPLPPSPEEVIERLRASLPADSILLEYFEARGSLYLFRLGPRDLKVIPLGPSEDIHDAIRLLHFQIGKPRLGPTRGTTAVTHHLRELYQRLVAPAELSSTRFRHLVFAPYRRLHGLPFAALDDGERPLIDRFTLSTAPSAAVFAACRRLPQSESYQSLVMAVPDRNAPRIGEEAREVAGLLSGANLVEGAEASISAFRNLAPQSRIVHLAAHGEFRRDNPAFSSIRLADGRLGVLDLQELTLGMDLLTLSGCNTGSSVPVGGDELLGLLRGFLSAGVRSIVASIWEIDDASAHAFMRSFYTQLRGGARLPEALGQAMNGIRAEFPHPFYWAPYVLVGDPEALG